MERGGARYAALDGWRGIAALGVAAFHFGVTNHFYDTSIIRSSWLFVDFFFVLSGFVIAHTYGNRVRTGGDAGLYMLRRFGRLWPLHVFTLLCLIAIESLKWGVMASTRISAGELPFSGSAAASAIPAHLVFLQSFGLFNTFTWNGPSWSIGAEFWTYLVFACVCLAGSWRRPLSIALVLTGFAVIALVERTLGGTYDLGFFRCLMGFFCGALVYDFRSTKAPRPMFPTVAEVASVATVLMFFSLYRGVQSTLPLASFLALPIFAAVLIVFAPERGQVSTLLLTRPVQSLGRWSYSIYMVHFVIITMMNSALRLCDKVFGTNFIIPDAISGAGPTFRAPLLLGDAMLLAFLVVVIACASLTWRFVEEPFRLYFNDIARRHQKPRNMGSQEPVLGQSQIPS